MTQSKREPDETRVPGEVDLSIIIVNWNSADYLRRCLKSIYANTGGVGFEVIVVDNASFDGSAQLVQREFPQVFFIQSKENFGFARANNLAYQHSRGKNILFLNPDTEVVGPAIRVLLSFLESVPNAGSIGCKLLNTDRSVQTSCIRSYPTILNQVFNAEAIRKIWPKSRLWGMRPLFESGVELAEVQAISGACLMTRREVFEHVGGFTTDFFMYAEDTDFCFKVERANWKNYYVGGAVALHHGGGSSCAKTGDQFGSILMRESTLKFLRLRRGKTYAVAYRAAIALVALVRLVVLGSFMALPSAPARRDSLRASFAKWRKLLRWSIGLEGWAKHPASSPGRTLG